MSRYDAEYLVTDAVIAGVEQAESDFNAWLGDEDKARFYENIELWINTEMTQQPITERTLKIIKEKAYSLYETMIIEVFI